MVVGCASSTFRNASASVRVFFTVDGMHRSQRRSISLSFKLLKVECAVLLMSP